MTRRRSSDEATTYCLVWIVVMVIVIVLYVYLAFQVDDHYEGALAAPSGIFDVVAGLGH